MTEIEWLTCNNPHRMLRVLDWREERERSTLPKAYRPSDRKLRLFGCACCRSIWHLLADERSRAAVEVAERYADGLATLEEKAAASYQAVQVAGDCTILAWVCVGGNQWKQQGRSLVSIAASGLCKPTSFATSSGTRGGRC